MPGLVSVKKSIEESDEFAHGGDESNLGAFAVIAEASIEGLEIGFVAHRAESCHIDGATNAGASTGDVTLTTMGSAVVIDGGHSDQSRSLLGTDSAKLGKFGQDDGCGEIGNTWNADENVTAMGKFLIGIDSKRDRGIDGGELAFQGSKALFEKDGDEGIGVFAAVLLGNHHVDELPSPG